MIPERAYLAASLSKCIAPGLRVSFLLAPTRDAAGAITSALRASVQMPVSLTIAVVMRWLRDGSADAIIAAIRSEAAARQKSPQAALAGHRLCGASERHHVWIDAAEALERPEFVGAVMVQFLAAGIAAVRHLQERRGICAPCGTSGSGRAGRSTGRF